MLYPLGLSDAATMAALHHKTMERSWDKNGFSRFLSDPCGVAYGYRERTDLMAFILGRQVEDEAEILTLAVDPNYWRQGLGRKVLQHFLDHSGSGSVFLEVNETNRSARSLYRAAGFEEEGIRKEYYATSHGPQNAILMRKSIARKDKDR